MSILTINNRIRCIEASDNPLSADIGIIQADSGTWLFDVGNGAQNIAGLHDRYHIVLSHFHADHVGNLDLLPAESIYVSKETHNHVHKGTILHSDVHVGDMHIFPLPSSHAKGCLGLEVAEAYAFVGDALYCKVRDGFYVYNAQLLKAQIEVLTALRAPYLLVSHFEGLVRRKEDVLEELNAIYGMREKNMPEIRIGMEEE